MVAKVKLGKVSKSEALPTIFPKHYSNPHRLTKFFNEVARFEQLDFLSPLVK
jgi:hypothetical protein